MKKIKAKDLKIGDVIRQLDNQGNMFVSPFLDLTIVQIKECEQLKRKEIKVFRPYTSLGDFTHTGGVTPYVGIEEFSMFPDPEEEFMFLENRYYGKP